jgi:hypothetical protein
MSLCGRQITVTCNRCDGTGSVPDQVSDDARPEGDATPPAAVSPYVVRADGGATMILTLVAAALVLLTVAVTTLGSFPGPVVLVLACAGFEALHQATHIYRRCRCDRRPPIQITVIRDW